MRNNLAAFVAILVMTVANQSMADIIVYNVDFTSGGGNTITTPVGFEAVATDAAGAAAIWNNVPMLTATDILTSANAASNVDLAVTSTNSGTGSNGQSANATNPVSTNPLLRDYVFDNTNSGLTDPGIGRNLTLTISGLEATSTYDLYFYGGTQFRSTDNNVQEVTVGATTQTITRAADINNEDFILGGNYLIFSGLTAGTGEIVASVVSTSFNDEPTINGFQLVEVTAVPEPGTLAVFAFGAFGLIARRKRR